MFARRYYLCLARVQHHIHCIRLACQQAVAAETFNAAQNAHAPSLHAHTIVIAHQSNSCYKLLQLSAQQSHHVGAFFPRPEPIEVRCVQCRWLLVQTLRASYGRACNIRADLFGKVTSVLSTHNLCVSDA